MDDLKIDENFESFMEVDDDEKGKSERFQIPTI